MSSKLTNHVRPVVPNAGQVKLDPSAFVSAATLRFGERFLWKVSAWLGSKNPGLGKASLVEATNQIGQILRSLQGFLEGGDLYNPHAETGICPQKRSKHIFWCRHPCQQGAPTMGCEEGASARDFQRGQPLSEDYAHLTRSEYIKLKAQRRDAALAIQTQIKAPQLGTWADGLALCGLGSRGSFCFFVFSVSGWTWNPKRSRPRRSLKERSI